MLAQEPGVIVTDHPDIADYTTPVPQRPEFRGIQVVHNADRQWQNHFADQNPIAFFGFDSLDAIVRYVKGIPQSIIVDNDRNDAWYKDGGNWTGTADMQEALELATKGWPEGVKLVEMIIERLTGQNAIERRQKYNVAGGSVNVGRMLSGNPEHMIGRPKQPGSKIITFFSEGFMSASVTVLDAIIRAAIIAAIVDILETNKFQCEIVSITTAHDTRNRPLFQIATTLKQAGEPLSISDVVFGLGHPSFFRRLGFAVLATTESLRNHWSYMGYPSDAFNKDHPPGPNEIYISQIDFESSDIEGSLIERVFKIWDLIIPDKLPITIKRK